MPDITVYVTSDGTWYSRLMGQGQRVVVAAALNTVGTVHVTEWRPETGDDWPVYFIPVLAGPDVPPVTIEVAMNDHQQEVPFYWHLEELTDALTAETLAWLDTRHRELEGKGFRFAVKWLLRPAAGSVTDYRTRLTTGRYFPTQK